MTRATVLLSTLAMAANVLASTATNLMPAPAHLTEHSDALAVDSSHNSVALPKDAEPRIRSAVARMLARWKRLTGVSFEMADDGQPTLLAIECGKPSRPIPELGEDESYTLHVTADLASLHASTTLGVLRGLATLDQLLGNESGHWALPSVDIDDAPRFPWRGLMLDVCRHWQPMDVVKRTLDGMAAVKLNVLHLHLTENQGFRIESKTHPELHEQGSDGQYFTQDQMREIIAYAAERGIRVVPEFDLPGHATSWLVSHPELASAPGPYAIERKWGIFPPTFDPTNEKTYELLGEFLGEMAGLFPDAFMHIGGDEVEGSQWGENSAIQSFMREHGLKTNADLQARFNARLGEILAKNGKRMVGWDEILHPGLSKSAVIQSWRGTEALAEAARQGYCGILSNGFYIDLSFPAADHYLPDPVPQDSTLSSEEAARILGGEATMWSEWVTPDTIDSRIWPRTAVIAERLWSPQSRRDVADMYRRLPAVSRYLESIGLRHQSCIDPLIREIAGPAATHADLADLRLVADIVEPVKSYRRGREQPDANQTTPLNGLVDASRPDSTLSRALSVQIDDVVFGNAPASELVPTFTQWKLAAQRLADAGVSRSNPKLVPLFQNLAGLCEIGAAAAAQTVSGRNPAEWRITTLAEIDRLSTPVDACEIPLVPALRRLVVATAPSKSRTELSPAEWRKQIDTLAATKDKD